MVSSLAASYEVIQKDVYGMASYRSLSKVLDIGQCEGAFSLLCRWRFPKAEIVGVEPFATARATADRFLSPYGIACLPVALGNGQSVDCIDTGFTQCNLTQPGTQVPSLTLAQIFTALNWTADKQTFVKVDCEGAERHIFTDRASRQILDSVNFAMEVHFPCGRHDRHKDYPQWEVYNAYFEKMRTTHDIDYVHSSRHNGVGIYRGKLKDRWTYEKPNGSSSSQ